MTPGWKKKDRFTAITACGKAGPWRANRSLSHHRSTAFGTRTVTERRLRTDPVDVRPADREGGKERTFLDNRRPSAVRPWDATGISIIQISMTGGRRYPRPASGLARRVCAEGRCTFFESFTHSVRNEARFSFARPTQEDRTRAEWTMTITELKLNYD